MNASQAKVRGFVIRIKSMLSSDVVEEIRGLDGTAIEIDALASEIWNDRFCLGERYGLRVYRALGSPARWRRVDQLGHW
jgi:hypothetical protein